MIGLLFLNLLGSAISAGVNSLEASRSRAFQREMRDTQYQAAMKDMRKAGLNPILAAKVGGSQSGGAAQATSNITGGDGSALLKAGKIGLERELLRADVRRTDAERDLVMDRDEESILNQGLLQKENERSELGLEAARITGALDRTTVGKRAIQAGRLFDAASGAASSSMDLIKSMSTRGLGGR